MKNSPDFSAKCSTPAQASSQASSRSRQRRPSSPLRAHPQTLVFWKSVSAAGWMRPTSSSVRWSPAFPTSPSTTSISWADGLIDIAGEKAGIAKRGVPLVTQNYAPRIARKVGEHAAATGRLGWLEAQRGTHVSTAGQLHYRDAGGELELPLPNLEGMHQARNASLAVAMLRHQRELSVSRRCDGPRARNRRDWPGRLQLLKPGPSASRLPGRRVWVDGGHNRGASLAIAAADGRPSAVRPDLCADAHAARLGCVGAAGAARAQSAHDSASWTPASRPARHCHACPKPRGPARMLSGVHARSGHRIGSRRIR